MARETKRVVVPPGIRRSYAELDHAQLVAALHNLARRVGVQRVTMGDLAAELGVDVPLLYFHLPGKQAALDLLAESVLAEIPVPADGPWHARLVELYSAAHDVLLRVPGVAGLLRTRTPGESAHRLDRLSHSLLAEAGLAKARAAAAHLVLYSYVLGSVALEESRLIAPESRKECRAAGSFRGGLDVIIAGIQASAVW